MPSVGVGSSVSQSNSRAVVTVLVSSSVMYWWSCLGVSTPPEVGCTLFSSKMGGRTSLLQAAAPVSLSWVCFDEGLTSSPSDFMMFTTLEVASLVFQDFASFDFLESPDFVPQDLFGPITGYLHTSLNCVLVRNLKNEENLA